MTYFSRYILCENSFPLSSESGMLRHGHLPQFPNIVWRFWFFLATWALESLRKRHTFVQWPAKSHNSHHNHTQRDCHSCAYLSYCLLPTVECGILLQNVSFSCAYYMQLCLRSRSTWSWPPVMLLLLGRLVLSSARSICQKRYIHSL